MTVDPTDNLIVQRGSTLGKIEVQNMATIQNNDLLIVGRGSDSFKITGQDFKNSLAGGVGLQGSAVVAPTVADIGDTLTCTASAAGGTTPYTFDYQWFCQLDGTVDWVEHPGSNTDTVVLDAGDVDYRFRCHVTVTGANGGTLNLISNETGVIGDPAVAPIIGNVSLVESNPDADPRFTDQEFVASVTMTEDGVPVSTKTIDAYVEGSITTTGQFDESLESSTAVNEDYSSGVSFTGPDSGFQDATKMFDGDTSTFARSSSGGRIVWDCSKFDISNTVEIYTGGFLNTALITTDQNSQQVNIVAGSVVGWKSVSVPVGKPMKMEFWNNNNANATIYAVRIGGLTGEVLVDGGSYTSLQFAAGTDMTTLEAGDTVEQGITNGTVGSITDTTVTLSSSSGVWVDGNNVTGPEKTIVGDNAKKYLKFDSNGNVSDLLDAPQSPAYETTDADPTLTLKFPATFPSGNTPDDELGEGTKLVVEATATNSAGTSGPVTAEVQPEGAGAPPLNLNALTSLWAGNGTPGRNIVNGIDLVNHDGLVWIKDRTYDGWHQLYDTIRGPALSLVTNNNDAQSPLQINKLDGFNEDGFQLGNHVYVNSNSYNYVGWTFQKTAGYFDVVKVTITSGTGIGQHSLGKKPGFIIVKSINTNHGWITYHSAVGHTKYGVLSDTRAFSDDSANTAFVYEPTDTEFKVGSTMGPDGDYICYLFAEDTPGLIKCGSYQGIGSAQTIDVGFEPQWVLIKRSDSGAAANWQIRDSARGDNRVLYPNENSLDATNANLSFETSGFRLLDASFDLNGNGGTYVYVAIAKPTTRSLTQEEFNEQAIKFGTYDHRKHVECARLSEENRDALIQYFADQGYSLQDILSYL